MAHVATHPGTMRADHDSDTVENYEAHRRERALADADLQQERYGGIRWGAALYGWLVSTGIAAILTAILAAAGAAIALNTNSVTANAHTLTTSTAQAIGLSGAVALLIVLGVAYYAGGYVAGRLARFDGARQGVATWLMGLLIALVLGGAGAALGAKYNVLQQINLPHIPIGATLTKGGLIASIVALVVTLITAMIGGMSGERYHAKIDAGGHAAAPDEV